MKENFGEISIRGRLAYGASCLENALQHFNIEDKFLQTEVLPEYGRLRVPPTWHIGMVLLDK